ncbi:MAG TPA: winged helix-turn-helix domain-containing protein [Pyrinomonadaceae bacterium]|nr:winged helix-turn-helix domain-containing protein [Pyrinomonadaceae bacterium]
MNFEIDLQEGFFLEEWFVEPQLGRISKDEKIVQLEPKIMEVLVFLAENQGKTLKKEQFFNLVWADVNVTEHVLARAISELRRVLKDNPQNPRFIQTVPKIGYRLIMPISIESFQTQTNWQIPSTMPLPQPIATAQSSYFNFFIGGILTVVFLFAVWIIFAVTMHQFVMPHTN